MDKSTITAIIAVSSVFLGWALNELTRFLNNRKENRNLKRQVLFNLLEINHQLIRLDPKDIINVVVRVLKKHNLVEDDSIGEILHQLMGNVFKKDAISEIENLEDEYEAAVSKLALTNPILAFRLKGRTKISQIDNIFNQYYKNCIEMFPNDLDEVKQVEEVSDKMVIPDTIKDSIKNLKNDILKLALKINIRTWVRVRKLLRNSKKKALTEIENFADVTIKKILEISSN